LGDGSFKSEAKRWNEQAHLLFPDAGSVRMPTGRLDPCTERLQLYSEPELRVTSTLVKAWAKHYPVGSPFVIDEELQFGQYLQNAGTPYALRIWPQGGKRRKCGNVTVYVNDGVVDVNGAASARARLKAFIKDWAW
jgi:hypothetical protein